ncbi:transporter [Mangrovimonas spongiae]|uniref:Transporter n=1 Tax=Mangrovimonas spongiae TaxID=2494697 RepID=A0A3R9PI57_9FLAO|nr:transporter [Mangrovimonas spongiae]RSK38752.1 transporter [Mangrovimonas spongiae]
MKALKTYLFVGIFLCTVSAFSQYTEVINSNRPGVSKSAFAVGTNVVQFEIGPYMLNEDHSLRKTEDRSFGADFSVRYGLLWPQLEINLEGAFQSTKRTYTNSITDFEEKYSNFKTLTLGAKYLVYDPYKNAGEDKPNIYSWKANHSFKWSDLIPAVSVYAGANYDTKDNPYTAPGIEGFSPKVMVATQNNFASGWVFVTNFMLDRIGTDQSDFSYILTLTKSISDQWVLFGETQGISSDFYADNLIRFGGAYLWSRNFQLDTALTFNTKDTPSVFGVTLGASYRLDFHKDKKTDNGTSVEDELERQENAKGNNRKKRKKRSKSIDVDFD